MGRHLVALGSSFAAGATIEPIVNSDANRSGQNYPHLLLAKINATSKTGPWTLTDLTVSGATVLNVLSENQQAGRTIFPPQLSLLPKDADIITFTCGGNDLGYISGLVQESFASRDSYLSGVGPASAGGVTRWELQNRINTAVDRALQIAPNARVYLVEYLAVLGDCTKRSADWPLSTARRLHYQEVARTLAATYSSCARDWERKTSTEWEMPWARIVRVARESQGHAVGSDEPWVSGLNAPAPYHPNLEGHKQVADLVYKQLCSDKVL